VAVDWVWSYDGWNPDHEGVRESLCTLGNGYQATRGAFPGCRADAVHYPGVYVAGCFDRAVSTIDGATMDNESLVNLPDWLVVRFRPAGGGWLSPDTAPPSEYHLQVDLRTGLLERRALFVDADGHRTRLTERRLVHMGDPHLAALEMTICAENWSGPVEVDSGLDGNVANTGVASDRGFASQHLDLPTSSILDDDSVLLVVTTQQSKVRIAEAARTTLHHGGTRVAHSGTVAEAGYAGLQWRFELAGQVPVTIEKVVAVYTSQDPAISEPAAAAAQAVGLAGDFDALLAGHRTAWARQWASLTPQAGNGSVDRTLHLHAFHLAQTLSRHTIGLDTGVPARGLHGEGYRGHVFWDEVLVLPFLTFRAPSLVRAMLRYRYRRLARARQAAAEAGFQGAMFPWQSGSDGREETPTVLFNSRSGRWLPDRSRLQRHVGLAIAYNVWHYHQATGDIEFLAGYGGELLVEIARFFASATSFNQDRQRFEVRGVMGPDEFHDRYPGAVTSGIDNNAYTNVMVVWLLQRTAQALDVLEGYHAGELRRALGVSHEERHHWSEISAKMFVPFHDGVISQFEGYEALAELDWDGYRARYGNIGRLDLILEAEGDSPNRYKLSKQADVLMLLYLLSAEELREVLAGLGYRLPPRMVEATVQYYLARTSHGSTLSRVVDAWILARADREASWRYFTEATVADADDTQGGTTAEGIHLAAMAGTLDILQRCYTGLEVRDDQLWLNPRLAAELPELRLRLLYRGHWLSLHFTADEVEIQAAAAAAPPIKIRVGRRVVVVGAGQAVDVRLRS
jgi:trehalose/maltose hydrolase-like predicted phosphorylase